MLTYLSNVTVFNEASRLYRFYKPYIAFSWSNLPRAIGAVMAVGFMLAQTIIVNMWLLETSAALQVILFAPGLTIAALAPALLSCAVPLCLAAVCALTSMSLIIWLANEISNDISSSLLSKTMDSGSFYGVKFINDMGEKINLSIVLANDLENIFESTISLGSSYVIAMGQFATSCYQLWYLSSPLVLSCLSMTVAIPGYMFLSALAISAVYSCSISYLEKNLKNIQKKLSEQSDLLTAHLHHIDEHSESIALKKGSMREKNKLLDYIAQTKIYQKIYIKIYAPIVFVTTLFDYGLSFIGILLAAPAAISGKLESSNILSVSSYFKQIFDFLAWKKTKTAEITELNVSLDRFESFNTLMKKWEEIQKENQVALRVQKTKLGSKNLSIFTPNGDMIFDKTSFNFPVGKVTVIQGPSGIGKTTLFRALAGLWPFVKGELILPFDDNNQSKIYYIPQQACFPFRGTLLDAITYPNENAPSKPDRENIIDLMTKLGFSKETIQNLDRRDEWEKKLSGGEQQRIAIIGAIIKKPDLLFIDEGTNGLDPDTRFETEKILKEHLKKTTIVVIDHHSEQSARYYPFFDYKLKIDKSRDESKEKTITLSKFKHRLAS